MAERLSKQPFQISQMNLAEINDCFRRLQDELDRLAGLRGPIFLYDSTEFVDDNGQVLHSVGVKP